MWLVFFFCKLACKFQETVNYRAQVLLNPFLEHLRTFLIISQCTLYHNEEALMECSLQINSCNGMKCGQTFVGPNSPNKPSIWTENWTTQ